MWQRRQKVFLEPGEAAALAEAARTASARSAAHPRQGLLAALACVLETMAGDDGLMIVPATAATARQAARLHLRQGSRRRGAAAVLTVPRSAAGRRGRGPAKGLAPRAPAHQRPAATGTP